MHAFSLEGQHVAITGAGGGIGSAAARIASELGARVSATDLKAPALEGVQGSGHHADALDVTDQETLTLVIAASAIAESAGAGATTATVTRSR